MSGHTPFRALRNTNDPSSLPFIEDEEVEVEDEDDILPRYEESELNHLRHHLFRTGSSFKPTSREEIVGIENVLQEIDGITHWLRHSETYSAIGARLEPGVIFSGSPGTGKTLLARYVATESEAFFVNVRDFPHNGSFLHDSDIAALFSLSRSTFKRTNKPIILFWDEFEGAARERGRDNITPDQAAAISQLTAELDGIHGKNEGVLLIGCTNYDYQIDQALLRPGRMGIQIEFNAPDREGKEKLLNYYLQKVNTRGAINLEILSYFFDDDDTAATIEEAVNEGWRIAIMNRIKSGKMVERDSIYLTENDLIEVFLNRLIGPPPTFISLDSANLFDLAVHECGHALAALVWGIPLRLITVRPGKKALGRTFTAKINHSFGKIDEQRAQLRIGVGGIVAEDVTGIGRSIGSTGDTSAITNIASQLVDIHGEGKLGGLLNVAGFTERWDISPRISSYLLEQKDRDMMRELELAEQDVRIAFEGIGALAIMEIAETLSKTQTMTGEQFTALVIGGIGDPTNFRR